MKKKKREKKNTKGYVRVLLLQNIVSVRAVEEFRGLPPGTKKWWAFFAGFHLALPRCNNLGNSRMTKAKGLRVILSWGQNSGKIKIQQKKRILFYLLVSTQNGLRTAK